MKIDFRIMGVPSRKDNIEVLKRQLGITDASVFLDTEYRRNPMWTWKQTARLQGNPDATHLCIVQDDAVLPERFTEFCEYLVNKYTRDIYTLFNNRDFSGKYPYGSILQHGTITGGVAIIIPIEYVDGIIKCHDADCPNYPHDDEYICYWSSRHNVRVLTTYPSVVNIIDCESTLGNNYSASKAFTDNPFSIEWQGRTKHKWCSHDFSELGSKEYLPHRKKNTCINGKEKFMTLLEQFNYIPYAQKTERQELLPKIASIGDYSDIIPPLIVDEPFINLHVGHNVYLHPYLTIQGIGDIFIGNRCKVGCKVSLITSNHGVELDKRNETVCRPITIEDDVWIGANVTILGGVTIGRGSVIGSGSVVTKDIPQMCVAVGNPCKPIREI